MRKNRENIKGKCPKSHLKGRNLKCEKPGNYHYLTKRNTFIPFYERIMSNKEVIFPDM